MTSVDDVMRFSHVIEGGNYKREHNQASGLLLLLLSGCLDKCLGLY